MSFDSYYGEPAGLADEELLRVYGLAKRDHCYDGPLDDWPTRAERAATVAGLRAVEAATLARAGTPATPPPVPGEVQELVGLIRQIALAWEPDATLLGNMTAGQLARATDLLESLSQPQPVQASERLPGHIEQALIKAECALADIAEGEAEESDGDPLEWVEKRAADALARIRPVMRQHQIQTSEWPPVPAHPLDPVVKLNS